jgi:oligopeptide/dipeptide ABC transporter ATP-binding protein
MYMGRLVEQATVAEIYDNPLHPYTIALMSAIPRLKAPRKVDMKKLPGEVPSVFNPPPGCPFHPRCPFAGKECFTEKPPLVPVPGRPYHLLACRNK